jgi:hypothetical protein
VKLQTIVLNKFIKIMKKIFFSLCILSFSQFGFSQKDQVVMDIHGEKVTKSEFLQIYLKNNNDPKFDKVSLDDYLELFKKFKLKVVEAEALGYDTIPKLKKELEGYRKQLANPYLIDSASNNSLVLEAYERFKTEVRASHILLRLDPNALPKDTLDAYNRIMALKKRIEKGEDFASVAKMKNGSEDPSAVNNGGDLGYFTAFQMVYSFEEMAYKTPIGSISDPFRTRFGYHILKVTDKRPSRGTIKVAHIMIAAGKDIAKETSEAAEKTINELYEKYKGGKLAPEISLLLRIGFSACVLNMSNKMLSSSTPAFNDVLRQSPELMKMFTNATVNSMEQQNPAFAFANHLMQEQANKPRGPPPPAPVETKSQPAPPRPGMMYTEAPGNRPDIQAGRGAMFREQGVEMGQNYESVHQQKSVRMAPVGQAQAPMQAQQRPEMRGPQTSDIDNILSGLKTRTVNIHEETPNITMTAPDDDSMISISSLKDMQNTSLPKRTNRRRNNSAKNTVSLDI